MTTDAVKRALEAAAGTWACTCHPSKPCSDCIGYAAKAVSAFLRALPDFYGGDTINLAAAVTQAAQEGSGDGE